MFIANLKVQVKARCHFSSLPNGQRSKRKKDLSIFWQGDGEEVTHSPLVGIEIGKLFWRQSGNIYQGFMHPAPGFKSRSLNRASSCGWYVENSLKTRCTSGGHPHALMDCADCGASSAPNIHFGFKSFWTLRDAKPFSLLQFSD